MNDYERAAERFNRINDDIATITKAARSVIAWAEQEYEAAGANLAQYESSPGIPLPQYRPLSRAAREQMAVDDAHAAEREV